MRVSSWHVTSTHYTITVIASKRNAIHSSDDDDDVSVSRPSTHYVLQTCSVLSSCMRGCTRKHSFVFRFGVLKGLGPGRTTGHSLRAALNVKRTNHEQAVRPFVRLSVRHTRALWQNERKFCRHSYTIWKIDSSSFATWRMVGGDVLFYLKFWAKLTSPASKTAISNRYSLVAPQPLHLAKKVKLIGSRQQAFQWA